MEIIASNLLARYYWMGSSVENILPLQRRTKHATRIENNTEGWSFQNQVWAWYQKSVYLKRAASYTPFVHKNCTKALLLLFIECSVSKAAFLWSLKKGLGKTRHRFESTRTFIGEQTDREELERRIYPTYIYSLVDFSPWYIYNRLLYRGSIHSKKGATRRNAANNQQQHGCADASDPRRGFD